MMFALLLAVACGGTDSKPDAETSAAPAGHSLVSSPGDPTTTGSSEENPPVPPPRERFAGEDAAAIVPPAAGDPGERTA